MLCESENQSIYRDRRKSVGIVGGVEVRRV